MTHRWFVVPVLLACSAALLVPAGTAAARPAAADPAGAGAITPTSGGTGLGQVSALGGSPDTLVYSLQLPGTDEPAHLMARDLTGTTTDLGVEPAGTSTVSIVGSSVTTADAAGTVYWWDLDAHTQGSVALPAGDTYLTAAPTGFVYADGAALVERDVATGDDTALGTPIPGATTYHAAAGENGFVAGSGTTVDYQTWSRPGTFVHLDTRGLMLDCQAVVGDYAACLGPNGQHPAGLLPVHGGPAVAIQTHGQTATGAAVSGSTLIVDIDPYGYLFSRSYLDPTVGETGLDYAHRPLVSAYGKAVVASTDGTELFDVTESTFDPDVLLTAPTGGPRAAGFSLSPGQLVYNDDEQNAAVPPAGSSTLRTPVSTTSSPLLVGATSIVQAGDKGYARSGAVAPTTPLASGTTTVFPTGSGHAYHPSIGDVLTESLVVTGPHSSRIFDDLAIAAPQAADQWLPVLSGNRLSFVQLIGHQTAAAYVYDLATGRVTKLFGAALPDLTDLPAPAVSGNYVAYVAPDGSIRRRNLDTGAATVVSGATAGLEAASVFAAGNTVAWSRIVTTGSGDRVYSGYRDAVTGAHTYLGQSIVTSLSRSGPVVTDAAHGGGRYALDTFSGRHLPITDLSGESTIATLPQGSVQVDGTTGSWVDVGRVLKAAPLPIAAPAPRMEGGTLTPKPAHPDSVAWHPYVPYDEPLTACSVAVTSGTRTVATLACDRAAMQLGVADVAWDGRIGSHRASPGSYHYTITASGDGGSALDSEGHARPVTGHFVLGG